MFGLLMLRISDKFAEETRSNNAADTSHLYRHRQRNTLRNGQTDISHKETYSTHMYSVYTVYIKQRYREIHQQIDRETDTQTDRETDTQTDRETDTQTDRETDTQTDRETYTQTDRETDTRTDGQTDNERQICTYMYIYLSKEPYTQRKSTTYPQRHLCLHRLTLNMDDPSD